MQKSSRRMLLPTIELPGNTVFRAIRWNAITETYTVEYMNGQKEEFNLAKLMNILTVNDAKRYLEFVVTKDLKDQWIECVGELYCDARR